MYKAGSKAALAAGAKARQTRLRNQLLNGLSNTTTNRGIDIKKIAFKPIKESQFHKIEVNTPVDIFIHKSLNQIYVSPHRTNLSKK